MDRVLGPLRKRPSQPAFDLSAAKVWVKFDRDGTVNASYNVDSVTDTNTGDWTVVITSDFSGVDYAVVTGWRDDGGGGASDLFTHVAAQAAGSFAINMISATPALADPTGADDMHALAFGDQ